MNEILKSLISAFAKLPAIGHRSAERMAVHLLSQKSHSHLRQLIAIMSESDDKLVLCAQCSAITEKTQNPCRICADENRLGNILCVVENPGDVILMEAAGGFNGKYHVLMGRLSPSKKSGPENIRVGELLKRVATEKVEEVLLALNMDVESDATVAYLRERLAGAGVRLTRIATGVPVGSGISYADPLTLERAVSARREL